ncbi:MAG: zinc-ribbon domain-containing protein [Lachnospiraceae bacterium]|nr:zinc-ribbon domain-containing protein [Lachnospiraceae bacterium]
MASLKDAFAKSITTLNVKTNNFMEETKCKTYIATLEEEIITLKKQIGEIVYSIWTQDVDLKAQVAPLIGQIEEKQKEIKVQEERIAMLSVQEQQILGTGQNPMPNQFMGSPIQPVIQGTGVQSAADVIYCGSCGAQNASNYKFCIKCGVPLK